MGCTSAIFCPPLIVSDHIYPSPINLFFLTSTLCFKLLKDWPHTETHACSTGPSWKVLHPEHNSSNKTTRVTRRAVWQGQISERPDPARSRCCVKTNISDRQGKKRNAIYVPYLRCQHRKHLVAPTEARGTNCARQALSRANGPDQNRGWHERTRGSWSLKATSLKKMGPPNKDVWYFPDQ